MFDFTLTAEEVAAIDALDTGVRGGPIRKSSTRSCSNISVEEHNAQLTR
jgi:hypothetical protein